MQPFFFSSPSPFLNHFNSFNPLLQSWAELVGGIMSPTGILQNPYSGGEICGFYTWHPKVFFLFFIFTKRPYQRKFASSAPAYKATTQLILSKLMKLTVENK